MKKIKHFIDSNKGKDILTVFIVILVGLGSFELGRLSQENNSNSLKIDFKGSELAQSASKPENLSSAPISPKTVQNSSSGDYFGSTKGSKYYRKSCIAGKNIKEENRIYFPSADAAEKAGYQLSSSCE